MKVLVRALLRWSWVLILCLLVGWFGGKLLASLLPPTYQVTAIVELNGQSHASQIIQPVAAYATHVTSDSVLNPVLEKFHQIDRTSFVTKQLVVTSDNGAQDITIQVTLTDAKVAAEAANMLAQLLVEQQNAYIKAQYTQEIQIETTQINDEQKKIDQLNQQYVQAAQASPSNTALLQQLNSQVSQQQNLQSQDINQRQALVTEQALYSAPLSVVQSAAVPKKPSSIIGLIPLAPVILVVMLLVGVALVFLLESSAKRINGVAEVQQKAGLPVLGSLRWTSPSPQDVALSTICESKKPYAEECRVMMADVLFHAEEAHARVLAITGLRSGSGCSCIASQLAVLLAQSKRRVLLVDANLHEPSQHLHLNVSNNAGLAKMLEDIRRMKASESFTSTRKEIGEIRNGDANVVPELPTVNELPAVNMKTRGFSSMNIRRRAKAPFVEMRGQNMNMKNAYGNNDVSDQKVAAGYLLGTTPLTPNGVNGASNQKAVDIMPRFPFENYALPTSFQNLYVLPAGKPTMSPYSLLSIPEMGQFLKWASKPIDFVVIDCPSLVYAEAHVLGSLSDQTFLVVDATRDRQKKVLNAKEELLNTGVKLSGIILNKLGRWV
jgi:Mrp family chromosome partitioning ATPase